MRSVKLHKLKALNTKPRWRRNRRRQEQLSAGRSEMFSLGYARVGRPSRLRRMPKATMSCFCKRLPSTLICHQFKSATVILNLRERASTHEQFRNLPSSDLRLSYTIFGSSNPFRCSRPTSLFASASSKVSVLGSMRRRLWVRQAMLPAWHIRVLTWPE